MQENLQKIIEISEDINNNLKDNIFELNLHKANALINSGNIENNNNNAQSDLSINISNAEVEKLIQIFKVNKKTFKDFFYYKIFETRSIDEISLILKDFISDVNQKIFLNILDFCIREKNLVKFFRAFFINCI